MLETQSAARRLFEIQKMVKRLGFQGAVLEETFHALNELAAPGDQTLMRSLRSETRVKELSSRIIERAH